MSEQDLAVGFQMWDSSATSKLSARIRRGAGDRKGRNKVEAGWQRVALRNTNDTDVDGRLRMTL